MKLTGTTINKKQSKQAPMRIGVVGAGKAAQLFASHVSSSAPEAKITVIADQNIEKAEAVFAEIGMQNVLRASQKQTFENALRHENFIVSSDPDLLYVSKYIDVVVEAVDEPVIDKKALQTVQSFLRQIGLH